MAPFFFHVTNGSTFKEENCSSLEAARTHAAKIADELGKDRGYEGKIGEQVRGFGHFRWL
jgi:hypothetical protein